MSAPEDTTGPGESPGRSSKSTRFKPGRSGNPKGRPRKADAKPRLPSPLEQLFEDALIQEGDRLIPLTDGGRHGSITAIQAVARSTHVSAMKGNAHAQRTLLSLRLEIERRRQQERSKFFIEALDIKVALEQRLREWLGTGKAEDDIPVHPDDIELDFAKFEVRVFHPFDSVERRQRVETVDARDELILDIGLAEAALNVEYNRGLEATLEQAREILARYNAALPRRLRRERVQEIPWFYGELSKDAEEDLTQEADEHHYPSEPPGDNGCPS